MVSGSPPFTTPHTRMTEPRGAAPRPVYIPVFCIADHGPRAVGRLLLGPHFTSAILVWSGMWWEVAGILSEPHSPLLILIESRNVCFLNTSGTHPLLPFPTHHPSPGPEASCALTGPPCWCSRHQIGRLPGCSCPLLGSTADSMTSFAISSHVFLSPE